MTTIYEPTTYEVAVEFEDDFRPELEAHIREAQSEKTLKGIVIANSECFCLKQMREWFPQYAVTKGPETKNCVSIRWDKQWGEQLCAELEKHIEEARRWGYSGIQFDNSETFTVDLIHSFFPTYNVTKTYNGKISIEIPNNTLAIRLQTVEGTN